MCLKKNGVEKEVRLSLKIKIYLQDKHVHIMYSKCQFQFLVIFYFLEAQLLSKYIDVIDSLRN